jgi:hypothetical protein
MMAQSECNVAFIIQIVIITRLWIFVPRDHYYFTSKTVLYIITGTGAKYLNALSNFNHYY